MNETRHVDSLEIGQDIDFQRRFWTIERIGWVVITLLIVAALLGLFGSGPLSNTNAGNQGSPLWLEYSRFGRFKAPTTLQVHIGERAKPKEVARIWLDHRYMEGVQVMQVTPEPQSVKTASDRLIYTFGVAKPNQPITVTFHLKLEKIGLLSGRAGLINGPSFDFGQFVYP
jgi:hypothetical protein